MTMVIQTTSASQREPYKISKYNSKFYTSVVNTQDSN